MHPSPPFVPWIHVGCIVWHPFCAFKYSQSLTFLQVLFWKWPSLFFSEGKCRVILSSVESRTSFPTGTLKFIVSYLKWGIDKLEEMRLRGIGDVVSEVILPGQFEAEQGCAHASRSHRFLCFSCLLALIQSSWFSSITSQLGCATEELINRPPNTSVYALSITSKIYSLLF